MIITQRCRKSCWSLEVASHFYSTKILKFRLFHIQIQTFWRHYTEIISLSTEVSNWVALVFQCRGGAKDSDGRYITLWYITSLVWQRSSNTPKCRRDTRWRARTVPHKYDWSHPTEMKPDRRHSIAYLYLSLTLM